MWSINVAAVIDVDDGDGPGCVVNPIDDPVRAAASAESGRQRGVSRFPTRYGSSSNGPVMNSYAAAATASGSRSVNDRRTVGVVRRREGSPSGGELTQACGAGQPSPLPTPRPRLPHLGPVPRRTRRAAVPAGCFASRTERPGGRLLRRPGSRCRTRVFTGSAQERYLS
jgi:hypothetical protein